MGELYQNWCSWEKRRLWSYKIHSEDEFVNIIGTVWQTVTRPMNNLTHLQLQVVFFFFSLNTKIISWKKRKEWLRTGNRPPYLRIVASQDNVTYGYAKKSVEMLVTQSCQTVWDPTDCGPPDSSVHGILRASILEWVAVSFSRESSRPRDWTHVSCITGGHFTAGHQRSPKQHAFFFFFNMDTQRKHLLKQGNAKFSSTIFKKWWKESSLTFFWWN